MHPYSGCRENPFHFKLSTCHQHKRSRAPVGITKLCSSEMRFFSLLFEALHILTHRIPALEMQMQCWSHLSLYLFIFFLSYVYIPFTWVESQFQKFIVLFFVVMFEHYLISGFNIAGFATFCYLCSVNSNNSHSCLIYQL